MLLPSLRNRAEIESRRNPHRGVRSRSSMDYKIGEINTERTHRCTSYLGNYYLSFVFEMDSVSPGPSHETQSMGERGSMGIQETHSFPSYPRIIVARRPHRICDTGRSCKGSDANFGSVSESIRGTLGSARDPRHENGKRKISWCKLHDQHRNIYS